MNEPHGPYLENQIRKTRLFPLPNLVMFPHVVRPLHIFEPRYRELLETAMADDETFTLAVLEPGWESDYNGRPPVSPIACLGRVAAHQKLADGTYNLLFHGQQRVHILRELPSAHSFREAEVAVMDDRYPSKTEAQRPRLRKRLMAAFEQMLERAGVENLAANFKQALEELNSGQLPLGVLTDVVAYSMDLELSVKQELLKELNVDQRAEYLADLLERDQTLRGSIDFPPPFSEN